jgi:DNA-binding CsgD family transcriptional regulator
MNASPLTMKLAHAELQRLSLAPEHAPQRLLGILQRAMPFDTGYLMVLDPLSAWPTALETIGVTPAEQATWFLTHPMLAGGMPSLTALARSRRHVTRLTHRAGGDLIREPHAHRIGAGGLQGSELRATFSRKGLLWGAVSLVRRSGAQEFDERDQAFLESIAPLITDVLHAGALRHDARRAQPAPRRQHEHPEDHYRPGVLSIHRDGTVAMLTPSARYWLQELTAGRDTHLRGGLPDIIWLAASALEPGPGTAAPSKPVVHVQSRSGIWLTIEAFRAPSTAAATAAGPDTGEIMVVIGPSTPDEIVELRERLYGLSARERQIAELVIRGFSTRQISRGLSIAESTVQGHLTHIFDKVQVGSRRALIQRLLIDQLFPATGQERALRH